MVNEKKTKYLDKFQLLNKSELELFNRLEEAMPKLIVFAQVSMSQVFYLHPRQRDTFSKLGEIGRKSIDFLLCRRDDTSIVAAIELNGPKHEEPEQIESDKKKRAALKEAGIPLMIYTPDALPDIATIRKTMAPLIVDRRKYEEEKLERIQKKAPKKEE
jgi:very-short-patch-repair endonuclease